MSIEHEAAFADDPIAVLEPENRGRPGKVWCVANVDNERDGLDNLVACGVVCANLKAAKQVAYQKAKSLLDVYNDELAYRKKPQISFEEAWDEVDHDDGIEHEYGFDPKSDLVSYRSIRVFKCELAYDIKEGL